MPKQITINYQTQWSNDNLGKAISLYFEPHTPIEHIINEAENAMKSVYGSSLKIDYQSHKKQFRQVYRNMLPSYKGWRVLYKKPGQASSYKTITEKFSYQKSKRVDHSRKYLMHSRLWRHELYPLVDDMEIGPVLKVETICQRLNEKIDQITLKALIKNWWPFLVSINKNYQDLSQNDGLNFSKIELSNSWQEISDDIEQLYTHWKQLNRLGKNSKMTKTNVYDLLKSKCKTMKGWRVKILRDSVGPNKYT